MTQEQLRAIQCNDHKILVKAGAGTGKTEVLTRRILRLVEEDPQMSVLNMAVITFTNQATDEMLSRLKKHFFRRWQETADPVQKDRLRYELELLNMAQVSTIHRFCRLILDLAGPMEIKGARYAPGYEVKKGVVHEALDHVLDQWFKGEGAEHPLLNFVPVYQIREELLFLYQTIRSKGWDIEKVVSANRTSNLLREIPGHNQKIRRSLGDLLIKLDEEYKRRKIRQLDPDDLLEYTYQVLDERPDICRRVQQKFRHIFVDEFQDTSLFQTRILQKLCEGPDGCCLFAVGDLKQSIYQFRGADPGSYEEAQKWIRQGGTVLHLSTNFRSVKALVERINTFFRGMQNDDSRPVFVAEDLVPFRTGDEEEVIQWMDPGKNPAKTLADFLRTQKENGIPMHNFAVLFRTNRAMLEYEKYLTDQGVKVQIIGGGNFFQKREIIDLYRLLRFLLTPDNPISRSEAASMEYVESRPEVLEKFLEEMRPVLDTFTVAQLLEKIYDSKALAVRRFYRQRGRVQALFNLDRLKEITRDRFRGERVQLVEYVDWLSHNIQTNYDEKQAETFETMKDAVKLITIHSAKGLEFPYVVLTELERQLDSESLMPSILPDLETGIEFKLEKHSERGIYIQSSNYYDALKAYMKEYQAEEARILYVALTRAKERIYLLGHSPEAKPYKRPSFGKWLIGI